MSEVEDLKKQLFHVHSAGLKLLSSLDPLASPAGTEPGGTSEADQQRVLNQVRKMVVQADGLVSRLKALGSVTESREKHPNSEEFGSLEAYFSVPIRLRESLRMSVLKLKEASGKAELQRKEELLGDAAERRKTLLASEKGSSAAMVAQSKELSRILQRTSGIISAEVQRTAKAHEFLEGSKETLKAASAGLKNVSASTKAGAKAVNALRRREWMDRMLVRLAMLFYFSVVFYIIHKRLGVRIFGLVKEVVSWVWPATEKYDEL